ncbi:TlpA family protein disulfide reductase [Candidatus Bathyarchaeota archaeon]|jgi:thiol-disulfide isomerase/thioredoxin|nr:TlpA family protein disulfide reductase [Candidatus Bathyarchaeota archaeon]MBT4320562.1 TlpA family protein disulfide reductase [Candidatus Bathyarchaeota archaeon]MBT4423512.1 TlpA family protein disulfide reductase [Candidatus Bathyarchaeota archaeon]MBT5642236.1 TlpA family protein disulfide reductase [Candidatus Bathyarchaeota archaeon]MBT6604787.1 TlpA family protein disulfide reductase [Candidatus Bathyarchaeota archaeon]
MSELKSLFKYLAVALVIVVGGYLVWSNFVKPDETGEIGANMGDTLLDQEIVGIFGEKIQFSDYRGSILVIDFMAPWCPPCKDQIPILREIETVPGVEVLTINMDYRYNMTSLAEFAADEGITWFFGHSPMTALEFEVSAIPTILVVDQNGIVIHRGFMTTFNEFNSIISPLLG